MYLTLRSVWALALGAVAVIAFPRPLSPVVWPAGVALAALADAVAAPSPPAGAGESGPEEVGRGAPQPVRSRTVATK